MKRYIILICGLLGMCLAATAQTWGETSLIIDQGDLTLAIGEEAKVTCTYDGTKKLQWSTTDVNVAKVSGEGTSATVTAVGEGSTYIMVQETSGNGGWGGGGGYGELDYIKVTVTGHPLTDADLTFEPASISNGQFASGTHWYTLRIRGSKYIHTDEFGIVMCSTDTPDSVHYLWTLTGSMAKGFQFYNYSTGATMVLTTLPDTDGEEYYYANVYAKMIDTSELENLESSTFRPSRNGEGFTFTIKSEQYAGLNDHSSAGYIRIWDSSANLTDNGACIVFAEVDPVDLGGSPSGEIIEDENIVLDVTELSLSTGDTHQLEATILPEEATYKRVTWKSSNPAVASVENGLVTARSAGTATITATSFSGHVAEVQVVVTLDVNTKGLVINEVLAANVDQYMDPSYNYGSWVEFYNGSNRDINLSGLFLTDDMSQPGQWPLSSLNLTYRNYQKGSYSYPPRVECSSVVPAKGYCIVWFDHNDWRYPMMCPFKLDYDGGTLYVTDGANEVMKCEYPESIARASWARTTDGGDEWAWTSAPTLGSSNAKTVYASKRLAAPTVEGDAQIFTGTTTIRVSWPEGSTLRYTVDGSTPSAKHGETSTDGVFTVDNTTVFRFCAVQDGMLTSPVVTRTLISNQYEETLPVMSLVTEEGNLYDDDYGIMTRGSNGRPGLGQGSRCNWNMDWDRPANIEFLSKDGQSLFNQEANIAVCGGWSRAYEPISFKVKGKKQYEHMNYLPYSFFSAKPYIKNKTLQMRNGGNDNPGNGGTGRLKDAAIQTVVLSSGLNIDGQAYEPVHLYRNGQYAGLINMREPNNRDLVYSNYGYDDTEVDQFEMDCDSSYVQSVGTREAFERWYDLSERCADPEVYAELKQICDVEEFCNYMGLQCYLAMSDFGYNNVKGYRPRVDHGKFRMVLFDLDSSSSSGNGFSQIGGMSTRTWNSQYEGTNGSKGTRVTGEIEFATIWRNMMENSAEFRKQFVDQFCILCGSVLEPERAAAVIDSLVENVSLAADLEYELAGKSLSPASVGRTLKSSYFSNSRINSVMSNLTNFSYLYEETAYMERQSLDLSQNMPSGRLFLNNLPIPTGQLRGRVFAPVTLRAEAPAGYRFAGWKGVENKEEEGGSETMFKMGDSWYYYDQGSLDEMGWYGTGYNDLDWASGDAPLGYSRNVDIKTKTTEGPITTYFRKYVTLEQQPETVTLDYIVDDGFAIYVNGKEAGRYNLNEGAKFDDYTPSYAGDYFSGKLEIDPTLFHEGSNTIAVEVHNSSATSSDIVWDAEMTYTIASREPEEKPEEHYLSTDVEYTLPTSGDIVVEAVYVPLTEEERALTDLCPVKVNEVSAANSIYINDYYKKDDWVELVNTTAEDIDLTGYYLSDNREKPLKFQITEAPAGCDNIIPAHGHRVIWCSKRDRQGQEIHASFKLDNEEGSCVILTAPESAWADTLTYTVMNGDETCGLYPDGTSSTYLMQITTIAKPNMLTMYAQNYDEKAIEPEPVEPGPEPEPDGVKLVSQNNELGINYSAETIIVTNEYHTATTLTVVNAEGQTCLTTVLSMEAGSATVSTTGLPAGVYVARATDTEGTRVSTKFQVR